MSGGVVPGGRIRKSVSQMDDICASFGFRPFVEKDLDDSDAAVGLRLDMLDVVDGGGHGPLGDGHKARRHLLRRHSRKAPDDADHRNIDSRKNVRGHPRDGDDPEQDDEHRHDRESIGSPKR